MSLDDLTRDWTIIGSGPTGIELSGDDYRHSPGNLRLIGRVLVVNNAIRRLPLDLVADFLFIPQQAKNLPLGLARRAGIRLLSCASCASAPASWGLDDPQGVELLQSVPVPRNGKGFPQWARGGPYSPCIDPIGVMAVEYAVNAGATSVEVFGFEGLPGDSWGAGRMIDVQREQLRHVVAACPDVRFTFRGRCRWSLAGENVRFPDAA